MGELKVKINDKTENMFREAAMHEFGHRKGSLSLAAEKVLGSWARQHESLDRLRNSSKGNVEDPVKSLRGILKHVKTDSVTLVHESYKERGERWKKHVH